MKPVTVGEVVRHAKSSCKSCHGSGAVAQWVYLDANNQTRREEVCRCARKRFLKANREKISIQGESDWQWKEAA
jgi:hypothetical protein